MRNELARVEERLRAILNELGNDSMDPDLRARYVMPAVEHLFRQGGKLLRPLLVLLAARSAAPISTAAGDALLRTAAAVELLHTASLAHDDIVDGSPSRRGLPSLHAAFGNTAAVLIGDLFYSRFFQELAGLPGVRSDIRIRLLDLFLSVTGRMCEGELIEQGMMAEGRSPGLEAYLAILEAKTAGLVSACCAAGSLLNGASERTTQALADYGRALGILFQLVDDREDGDARFAQTEILAAKAAEYRGQAEACLRALAMDAAIEMRPENDAMEMLRELPDFILSRATPGAGP